MIYSIGSIKNRDDYIKETLRVRPALLQFAGLLSRFVTAIMFVSMLTTPAKAANKLSKEFLIGGGAI